MKIRFEILNLDYRVDRREYCLRNLRECRVPEKDIHFFKAVNGLDYESVVEMINTHKEKYNTLGVNASFKSIGHCSEGRGSAGYVLSTIDILYNFIHNNDYDFLYFNQDDNILLQNYGLLCEIVAELTTYNKNFQVLQLYPHAPITQQHPDLKSPVNFMNHRGGDSGLILSKRGACNLFNITINTCQFLEYIIIHMRPQKDCFAVIDKTAFIHRGVPAGMNKDQDRVLINDKN